MKRGLETKMHRTVGSDVKGSDPFVKVFDLFLREDGALVDGCCSDSSDEFYNTPAPSEDIWKKFELLPTPPRSPTRDPVSDLTEELLPFSVAAEQLSLVSDLLDVDESSGNSNSAFVGLKWDLLHDCMWSGQCTDSCKQKNAFTSTLPTLTLADVVSVLPVSDLLLSSSRPETPPPIHAAATLNGGVPISPLASPLLSVSPVQLPTAVTCVDPCSVLPYTPLSDHSYHQALAFRAPSALEGGGSDSSSADAILYHHKSDIKCEVSTSEDATNDTAAGELLKRTIVLSDTPSDSDDEIDVVTVTSSLPVIGQSHNCVFLNPAIRALTQKHQSSHTGKTNSTQQHHQHKQHQHQQQQHTSKPRLPRGRTGKASSSAQRSARAQSPPINSNTNDLWATSIITATATPTVRSRKRIAEEKAANVSRKYRRFKKSSNRCPSTSRSSSDSEDCEKRSQHNSMERKRRDDLRYAFQTLRESVPDLQDKPKAPKVLILNKATNYAKQLTSTGAVLERTLKQETKKRHELQRRLQQLQRMN